jgi:hypothetical protein
LKIQDCNLNLQAVSMATFVRDEPEESWLRTTDTGSIPLSLFDLYRRASYLSFGSAPSFLKDSENILFSYFALMMRSLANSLTDADSECKELLEANKETYYPGKHLDDLTWTREKSEAAAKRASEAFRSLLMSLHASLDALSEIIAVFSQGTIKRLKVGRAEFASIEAWLETDYEQSSLITTPRDIYLSELHATLRPIIHAAPPECGWLPYMRHLRNKAAHLGDGPFRSSVLRGNDGGFYTFIPREWPYLWEKYMKPLGEQQSISMSDLLQRMLMHQDIDEFAQAALRKVKQVVSEACSLTAKAYTDFSNFGFNQIAFDELASNSKEFAFQHFI